LCSATVKHWLISDERCSIIATTNAAGNTLSNNYYDEYGYPGSGNTGRFGYTGQLWLDDAEVYHYKARAYHPGLGRFMQTDSIGQTGGMNIYAYVGGDPVNATDPSGLHCVPITAPGPVNTGNVQRMDCDHMEWARPGDAFALGNASDGAYLRSLSGSSGQSSNVGGGLSADQSLTYAHAMPNVCRVIERYNTGGLSFDLECAPWARMEVSVMFVRRPASAGFPGLGAIASRATELGEGLLVSAGNFEINHQTHEPIFSSFPVLGTQYQTQSSATVLLQRVRPAFVEQTLPTTGRILIEMGPYQTGNIQVRLTTPVVGEIGPCCRRS
jgi:RHS repeat-associated protein